MPSSSPALVVNRLIDSLPAIARKRFLEKCTQEKLVFGESKCTAGIPMANVFFPLTGFISLVAPMDGHEPLEIGIVGNEGMLGATLALGIDAAPTDSVVQGSGTALRMTSLQFHRQLKQNPGLQRTINRYLYLQIEQLARIAACNSFHDVMARLSRWLLLTHDRAHNESFQLTHQFLADMLGVRRSAVTIAAGELRRRNLIRYARGRIRVISRKGLESAACECYAAGIDAYDQYLPVKISDSASRS